MSTHCTLDARDLARRWGGLGPPNAVRPNRSIEVGSPQREQWVQLAVCGTWRGHYSGTYDITPARVRCALDYFDRHYRANRTDLVVDYEHASLWGGRDGLSRAAGWIDEMQARESDSELWAHVRWNDRALELFGQREYRYLSPVFVFNGADRITGENVPMFLASVALTNTPFLTELEAVANAQQVAASLTHNSEVADGEPDWGQVDKTRLPRAAFADQGEEDSKSTWSYPHHWVRDARDTDNDGIIDAGTMYLHRGGLTAAWAAAQGARSGQKAPQDIIEHLDAHRRAIGLGEERESSRRPSMDWKLLAAKLGLAADATEAEVAAKLDAMINAAAQAAQAPAVANSLCTALGLDHGAGEQAAREAIVKLRAPQAAYAMVNSAAGLPPDASPDQLRARVAELVQRIAGDRATQIVNTALAEHKIRQDEVDFWRRIAAANPDAAEAHLRAASPLVDKPLTIAASAEGDPLADLTPEDKAVARQMGNDPAKVAATKKAMQMA